MITALLRMLADRTRLVLPIGVFIGLLLPDLAGLLRPILAPVVVFLLVQAMLRVDWPALLLILQRPLTAGLTVSWLLLAAPVLTALVLTALPVRDELRLPLILAAAMPPILSGPALATLLGLDGALALVVVVSATLAVPVTLPLLVPFLVPEAGATEAGALFLRLSLIVGGSALASAAIRRWIGAARLSNLRREVDGVGVVLLLLFAVGVMEGVSARLFEQPGVVLMFVFAAFALNLIQQAVGTLVFRPAGPRRAASVGFITGNRNAALLLAALPGLGGDALLLYVAAAQFPIYTLPSLLYPVYHRYVSPEGSRRQPRA